MAESERTKLIKLINKRKINDFGGLAGTDPSEIDIFPSKQNPRWIIFNTKHGGGMLMTESINGRVRYNMWKSKVSAEIYSGFTVRHLTREMNLITEEEVPLFERLFGSTR